MRGSRRHRAGSVGGTALARAGRALSCGLVMGLTGLAPGGAAEAAGSTSRSYPPAAISVEVAPKAVGELVNRQRNRVGRGGVSQSGRLAEVARRHAEDMARNGYFSHTSRNGAGLTDRLRAAGYRYCWAGEAIAQGQPDADAVVRAWMTSRGHKKIVLHRKAVEYGLALAPNRTWVLVMARPGC